MKMETYWKKTDAAQHGKKLSRLSLDTLGKEVRRLVPPYGKPLKTWDDIIKFIPELEFRGSIYTENKV